MVLISIKKGVVQQKSYFPTMQIWGFSVSFMPLGFLAFLSFSVNRKLYLSCRCLFNLNMSNKKLEQSTRSVLKEWYSQTFHKIYWKTSELEYLSFIIKLQAEGIKPNFSKIFRNTNFLEYQLLV